MVNMTCSTWHAPTWHAQTGHAQTGHAPTWHTIQYNTIITLIETPLRERPYSSLAASLIKKRKFSKLYRLVQTGNLETKYLISPDQVGKLLQRAQSLAGIWRRQVKCWDVLVPVQRSSKILVRRQRNYEGPFAQFVSREQSNHHEQQIAGDNCTDRHWPVQACRTDTKEPDRANTCRPIIRACTGFFDEWEAMLQHDMLKHDMLKHDMVQHDMIQNGMIHHDMIQHDMVQHDMLQHDMIQQWHASTWHALCIYFNHSYRRPY